MPLVKAANAEGHAVFREVYLPYLEACCSFQMELVQLSSLLLAIEAFHLQFLVYHSLVHNFPAFMAIFWPLLIRIS